LSRAAEKSVRAFVQLWAAIRNDPRSVEAIALASGVDRNTIWLWVDGETTKPNIAQVDKVARALGFSLELSPSPPAAQDLGGSN
jgi:DNA-binding phage protein